MDYDVWGEEDEKTIKFSLLFQIICGSERTFSRSERRAEKKRKKRRLASGLFFLQKRRGRREFSKTEKPLLLTNADPSHSITIPLFTCFIIYILLLNGPIDDDDDDDDDDVFIIFVFVFVFVSLDEEVVREEYHRRRRFEEEVQQQQKRAARRGGGEWGGR